MDFHINLEKWDISCSQTIDDKKDGFMHFCVGILEI